jgi:hypothetical protein
MRDCREVCAVFADDVWTSLHHNPLLGWGVRSVVDIAHGKQFAIGVKGACELLPSMALDLFLSLVACQPLTYDQGWRCEVSCNKYE